MRFGQNGDMVPNARSIYPTASVGTGIGAKCDPHSCVITSRLMIVVIGGHLNQGLHV